MASFDRDTCSLCAQLDGKVFRMSDYQVGLTAPPFHPWCRCCTCPYYADMEGIGERWTRNPDGTTKKIPANTTFDEWRQSFVQGPTPGLQTQAPVATITAKTTPHFQNVVQGLPSAPSGYTDALEQHYAAGNQTAQAVFERYVQPGSVADGAFSGTPHFDSRIQKVKMNFAADMKDPRGPATTFFHEHGHFVDFTSCAGSGYTSLQTPDFGDALKKDFEAYVKATMKANGTRKRRMPTPSLPGSSWTPITTPFPICSAGSPGTKPGAIMATPPATGHTTGCWRKRPCPHVCRSV